MYVLSFTSCTYHFTIIRLVIVKFNDLRGHSCLVYFYGNIFINNIFLFALSVKELTSIDSIVGTYLYIFIVFKSRITHTLLNTKSI